MTHTGATRVRSSAVGNSHFPTTLWSIVLSAARPGTPSADDAMARLCEAYWYPIYAYMRRRGFDRDEARDLTQEFFSRVIEKPYLSDVAPEKGRFRPFLLASVSISFLMSSIEPRHGSEVVESSFFRLKSRLPKVCTDSSLLTMPRQKLSTIAAGRSRFSIVRLVGFGRSRHIRISIEFNVS